MRALTFAGYGIINKRGQYLTSKEGGCCIWGPKEAAVIWPEQAWDELKTYIKPYCEQGLDIHTIAIALSVEVSTGYAIEFESGGYCKEHGPKEDGKGGQYVVDVPLREAHIVSAYEEALGFTEWCDFRCRVVEFKEYAPRENSHLPRLRVTKRWPWRIGIDMAELDRLRERIHPNPSC